MDLLAALKLLAAREVWASLEHDPADPKSPRPSDEYDYRRVCRWYSERFHTPLHAVFDLPVDFVWQQYFEVYFEQLAADDEPNSEEKWFKALDEACETPEERRKRLRDELKDKRVGDKFHEQVQEEERKKSEELAKAKKEGRLKPDTGTLGAVRREALASESRLPGGTGRDADWLLGKEPREIRMKFRED